MEHQPQLSTARGLVFDVAVWAGADELAGPVLGIAKSPTQVPATTHASALAAHAVYGASTDLIRRGLRRAL